MKQFVQPQFPAVAAVTFVAALMLALGCSGGDGKKSGGGVACKQSADSATWRAVIAYTKGANPYPQRFLTAALSDSALPDVGVEALQDRGPTWFFPPDTAGRTKVRNRMEEGVTYTTLLVAWHGLTREADTAVVVRLGGRYIGGQFEGKEGRAMAYRFHCPEGRWVITDSTEDKKS